MGSDGRPRIVLLVTLAGVGGAQSYVAALVPALAERFDVVVAAHGDGPLPEAVLAGGARYVALRHVRRAVGPRDVLGLIELVVLLRRERPVVVHANSSKAGILGRLAAVVARVPVRIFTAHGWAFGAHTGVAAALYRWADRAIAPLTTAVVCVAESERRAGTAARTCRPARTWVIHNAVDVAGQRRAGLRGDPPQVVWVGRLAAPKDPLTLVDALASLPRGSFRALLVGDGPLCDEVAAAVQGAGLGESVTMAGEVRDLASVLADADLFVLASGSEGFPISVLEAMATGLPVVASDVGGVAEAVVDGETGLLVPPGDATSLAGALSALLHDPTRRRAMGTAGRARAAARFDLPGFRAAHLALYEGLLAAAPKRSRR
ncbi:MAG TPA: glycosyltransferase family 4 protein [Baekduia sp.]|jgi:glycosyltransferase involved in cell wall biosynthesis